MPFDAVIANPGVGGVSFAMDTFTDTDNASKTICYVALGFGPLNGPYLEVTASRGFPVKEQRAGTGTTTQVADAASSQTILAANANRLGAFVFNDSSAVLYLKCAAGAASTTDYTCKVFPDTGVEIPAHYTGILTGIWESDSTGSARVTEFTA